MLKTGVFEDMKSIGINGQAIFSAELQNSPEQQEKDYQKWLTGNG
jgi:hypothetical protein